MEERILRKTAAGNYKADSVKRYVKELKDLYDRDFDEQRDRMMALRDENRRLKEELNGLRAKERSIAAAVVTAEQLAQNIVDEAEVHVRKRMKEAEEFEKKTKRLVDSYIERLFGIEKNISSLLTEIIHTTASIKDGGSAEAEAYENAAEIYHLLTNLNENAKEAEESIQPLAV